MSDDWWKRAIIYQIYPRSFHDTNNDGIGDLPGITEKLDYVASLGVDAIWISPFFTSPMKDFGYDVSNYRDIDPIFGTLNDFDALLEKAHDLGLKIIIDLVLSHTSDQHPWFHDSAKKDWYVWADSKDNNELPNNWQSVFGGPAWTWDERYKQYYLHNFLKEQPDLNFHNPEVQEEILDICKFWFDRGVDGFRMDVVNFYFHDQQLRDNPPTTQTKYATQFEADTPYSAQQHIYDKSRPENIGFLKKVRKLADSYSARILMGEVGDDNVYLRIREYTSPNLLHTCYNTDLMAGTEKQLTQELIREHIEKAHEQSMKWDDFCPTWALSNHDVVRAASRWYKLYDHNHDFSKMIIALLSCLPGTLCLYQGEELGLPEAEIPYEKLQDPWAKETWPTWQGRDGCRTPMPWDRKTPNDQWLPIPESHYALNMESQNANPDSTLNTTRNVLLWRKNNIDLFKAKFKFIETSNSKIIHIQYKKDEIETNCIFNLDNQVQIYNQVSMAPYSYKIDITRN